MKSYFYDINDFKVRHRHHRVKQYHSQKKSPSAETLIKLLKEGKKCIPDFHFQPPVEIEIPKHRYVSEAEVKYLRELSKRAIPVYGGFGSRTNVTYETTDYTESFFSDFEIWQFKRRQSKRPFYEVEQSIKKEDELDNPCHFHLKYYSTRKAPTGKELQEAFDKAKGRKKLREKIYVGALLRDIEAIVNNRSVYKKNGDFAGRNPGVRGWIMDNCPELFHAYKTLMRYKGIADKVKQAVGLKNSCAPIDIFLPGAQEQNIKIVSAK